MRQGRIGISSLSLVLGLNKPSQARVRAAASQAEREAMTRGQFGQFKHDLMLRPGGSPEERIGFIERAIRIRAEIQQIFLDADHWNRSVRKPDEELIDPDPKGEMKNALEELNKFIGPEQ